MLAGVLHVQLITGNGTCYLFRVKTCMFHSTELHYLFGQIWDFADWQFMAY